jgi:hypothetical protein
MKYSYGDEPVLKYKYPTEPTPKYQHSEDSYGRYREESYEYKNKAYQPYNKYADSPAHYPDSYLPGSPNYKPNKYADTPGYYPDILGNTPGYARYPSPPSSSYPDYPNAYTPAKCSKQVRKSHSTRTLPGTQAYKLGSATAACKAGMAAWQHWGH